MDGLQTNLFTPDVTYDHLHDVAWAPDGHMAIAVGSHNALVGWDAASRTARILRNGTLGNLYGVAWADDSQSALAVGYNGALVLYTAGGITDLANEGTNTWQGAAYVPGSGFLVVGTGGAMFFLNGATRTPVTSPTTSDLLAAAYSAIAGRAVVVGRGGAVLDVTPAGAATALASPVSDDLRGVAFESDTGKAIIAGGAGALLAYQSGAVANETHTPTDGGYYDITVTTSAEPAAIAVRNATAGSILFTNASFSSTLALGSGLAGVEAVARSPTEGYLLATGFFGMFVQAWNNGTWLNVSSPFRPVIADASWRAAGDLALLVGFNGTALLFNRATNATTALVVPNATASLRGVSWAPNGSEAIIVGGSAFWKYDAASGSITEPLGATGLDLYGLAFRPGGVEAVVVGGSGYIGRWDGAALVRVSASTLSQGFFTVRWHQDTFGAGDYAYAAGANIVARYDPPSTVSTVVRIGTFFGVGFIGDDVWAVGTQHQIQRYDAANGIWDNVSLPHAYNTTRFTRAVPLPSGGGLLIVGNQSFSAFVNLTKVLRFDTGFFADFNGVTYNPATREPLYFGPSSLAFSMREGVFPNLAPTAAIASPLNGSAWTTADTVAFDASTSSDPDGDTLRFSWWDNASGFLTSGASFGAQLSAGNHTVTVFVDDGQGNNVSASVSITVTVAQFPPVAVIDSPTASANVSDDDIITFNGASSFDPNVGDTLSFMWSSDRIGVFGNASIIVATLPAGTHAITLNVTDSTGRSAATTLLLAVRQGNLQPSPSIASPKEGVVYASNLPVLFDANGTTDPDSAILTYLWLVDGVEVGGGRMLTSNLTTGIHDVTLVVSDGRKSSQLVVSITVGGPADLPPKFLSIDPPEGTVLSGLVVLSGTVEVDAVNPVDYVEFRVGSGEWVRALGTVEWTKALDTTLTPNGEAVITFRASDGSNITETTRRYVIDNPFVNTPPTLDVLTPHSGALIQTAVDMAGSLSDPEDSNLTVDYRVGGGPWHAATVTPGAWSASLDPAPFPNGPVLIEVRAFDGVSYSQSAFVTVIVDNPTPVAGGLSGVLLLAAVLVLAGLGAAALVWWRKARG